MATFATRERRLIGERIRGGPAAKAGSEGFDEARAARVLPVLKLLLGATA